MRDLIATHGMSWYIPPFGFVSLFRLSATAAVMVGRRGGHNSFNTQSSGQWLDWLDENTQREAIKACKRACVCSTPTTTTTTTTLGTQRECLGDRALWKRKVMCRKCCLVVYIV